MRSTAALLCALGLAMPLAGCASTPRYIVTRTPLKVIDPAHPGLCVAIDPKNSAGIWWWDAGPSGCTDRSSTTMAADRAVVRSLGDTVSASFRVGLVSGGTLEMRLEAFSGRMRETISGMSVAAERRTSMNAPQRPGLGRR